jgi:hypothetical protein
MDVFADGPVPVVDHDRLFKEFLTTFFVEFLDLFFPKLAAPLDPGSIEFLRQEQYAHLLDGDVYHADLLVKARFRGSEAYFLIHVEHQSTAPSTFPERFFRYFAAIYLRHGVPVYPIVIYSGETPKKAQASVYKVDFPDGRVLRFHYHVVQLNRLSWRAFANRANPVASALMAKMKIAERERPRVKAECLRLLVTLKLDRARMRLIMTFVDSYLQLNDAEEGRFQRSITEAKWAPKEKKDVVEYVTSWERRGIEKGRMEGRMEGRLEGMLALRTVLLKNLVRRFGPLEDWVGDRVAAIHSVDELESLIDRAYSAPSLHDLGL